MWLYVTATKPTDSVTYGFLPAARDLGCAVTVLTDQPAKHSPAYGQMAGIEVLPCAVHDFRDVIRVVARHHPPDAIFSNSDHLQAPTALAASYFGLPGKDWRAATRVKDKALMRRHLAVAGVETVRSVAMPPNADPPSHFPLPAVLKPCTGVASEDVVLISDRAELVHRCLQIQSRRPGETLVLEEYLVGELYTLESLGDHRALHTLGGFRTTLSAPPYFIEERLDLVTPPADVVGVVVDRLRCLGVGFGACHTEYVRTEGGPRLVEVNYRAIGDHCDFLLGEARGVPLFAHILRVHLGEPLPADWPPAPAPGAAAVVYEIAADSGVVISAPVRMDRHDGEVLVRHRPLRQVGDHVDRTHSNRDYLGAIRAIGPDRGQIDAAIARFRAEHRWEIRA